MITITMKRLAELAARAQEAHRKAARRTEKALAANPSRPIETLLAQEDCTGEFAAAAEALAAIGRHRIANCSPSWTHKALAQVAAHRRAYLELTHILRTAAFAA